jgi:hypothetical protein
METLFAARFDQSYLRNLFTSQVIKASDLPREVSRAREVAYDTALAKWQLFCREREIGWRGEPGGFVKEVSLPDAENEIMSGLKLDWGKQPETWRERLGEGWKNFWGHPFRSTINEHIRSKAEEVGRSASWTATQGLGVLFERWFKEVHALAERHFLDRWGGQRLQAERMLTSDQQCVERLRRLDTSLPERMSLRQLLREQRNVYRSTLSESLRTTAVTPSRPKKPRPGTAEYLAARSP